MPEEKRICKKYSVPKSIRENWRSGENAPESVTIREANVADDVTAMKIARANEETTVAFELLKACVVQIDDRDVTRQEVEDFMKACPRSMRELLSHAWHTLNVYTDGEAEDFFTSEESVVL